MRDLDPNVYVVHHFNQLADLPPNALILMEWNPEFASLINQYRQAFSYQALRVVVWARADQHLEIRETAPDFYSWVSHRYDAPAQVPAFTLSTMVNQKKIRWEGGDIEAALEALGAKGEIHRFDLHQDLRYESLLSHAEKPGWKLWEHADNPTRMLRAMWAMAEKKGGASVFVEPQTVTPGWVPAHSRLVGLAEAVAKLERVKCPSPGRVVGLLDREPEAVDLMVRLVEGGKSWEELLSVLEDPQVVDPARVLAQAGMAEGAVAVRAGFFVEPEIQEALETGRKIAENLEVNQWEGVVTEALVYGESELATRWAEQSGELALQGMVLQKQGQYKQSIKLLEQNLKRCKKEFGYKHEKTFEARALLGISLVGAERYEEAISQLKGALKSVKGYRTIHWRSLLAFAFQSQKAFYRANKEMEQVISFCKNNFGEDHPNTIRYRNHYATMLREQNQFVAARTQCDLALEALLRAVGPEHPEAWTLQHNLATVLRELGDFEGAKKQFKKSFTQRVTHLGPYHSDTTVTAWGLFLLCLDTGEGELARSLLQDYLLWLVRPSQPLSSEQQYVLSELNKNLATYQELFITD